MIKLNRLAIVLTAASTLASLSAFAETRHRDDTDNWRGRREESRQQSQQKAQPRQESRNEQQQYRSENRNETRNDNRSSRNESTYRNNDRSYRNNDSSYRNDNRSYRNDNRSYRNTESYRYNNSSRYTTRGRVSRIEPWRGGYRVYIGGGYPFFVTNAWYRAHRLAVGIEIGLGGIWNSGGYYDVYDDGYGYGYSTSGDLRGVVESVDYRRGTAVVRDDISGSFVTIVLRGGDPRLGNMRPGDYVTLGGEWSRAGVFNAYNLLDQQYGRY